MKIIVLALLIFSGGCRCKRIVDLSHTLSTDSMPVEDGAAPLEMIKEHRDEGNGARFVT